MANALQNLAAAPQFRPLSIIRALWRRKLLIIVLALLGTGATIALVSSMQPVYTARATILVESQKIPETFVPSTVQTALEARLDTLKEQVLSHDRLWGLIETLRLYEDERKTLTREEVVGLMRKDISITLVRGWSARGPGAFRVEYETGRPEVAAEVVNRIGMFFVNENLRQRTSEAEGTSEFLDRQLAEAEARLRQQESKLAAFKVSHNGELPQQEPALLAGINQSRAELLGVQEGLGRAQQNKLILENSLADAEAILRERRQARQKAASRSAAEAANSVSAPPPPSALEEAQRQLRSLRARYYDSHPEVERMLAEVARLRREEAEAAAAARTPQTPAAAGRTEAARTDLPATDGRQDDRLEGNRIQDLRAQIALVTQEIERLESRRTRVLEEVAESQRRLQAIPVREQELAAVTRDYDTSKANYAALLNKKLAADIATNMERWQKSQKFMMLEPGQVPEKPTRPRRRLLIASGTAFSWLAAVALSFLLELKKNALLGEWELPASTNILACIPKMKLERL